MQIRASKLLECIYIYIYIYILHIMQSFESYSVVVLCDMRQPDVEDNTFQDYALLFAYEAGM